MKYDFFWGHTPKSNNNTGPHVYSQWSNHSFKSDGINFKTAEHYMMYRKAILFGDIDGISSQILDAPTPKVVKSLGRKIKGFNESLWNAHKYEIVLMGNLLKFSQNNELREYLLSSNDSILVEASPFDRIWGIGYNAQDAMENIENWGENLLGVALMDVRSFYTV